MRKIAVFFSGGVESVWAAWECIKRSYEVYAISYIRDEKHEVAVKKLLKMLEVKNYKFFEYPDILREYESSSQAYSEIRGRNLSLLSLAIHYLVQNKISQYTFGIVPGLFRDCCSTYWTWLKGAEELEFIDIISENYSKAKIMNELSLFFPEIVKNITVCDISPGNECGSCKKCCKFLTLSKWNGLYVKEENYSDAVILEARIYVNDLCDLNCSFCTYYPSYSEKKEIDDVIINELVKKIDELRIEQVMISGREPLLSIEKIEQLIEHFPKRICLMLNTSLPTYHPICEKFDRIYLSINCYTIRRHRFSRNVEKLLSDNAKRVISYIVYNDEKEKAELIDFAEKLGIGKHYLRSNFWLDKSISKSNMQCKKFRRRITVLPDGTVLGCVRDSYKDRFQSAEKLRISDISVENLKVHQVISKEACAGCRE